MNSVLRFSNGELIEYTVNGVPGQLKNGQPLPAEMNLGDKDIVTRVDWPFWAKALKVLAKPGDRGIGDVVHRTIGPENSEAFKAFYKKITGKDCGCTGRQTRWNALYPLK